MQELLSLNIHGFTIAFWGFLIAVMLTMFFTARSVQHAHSTNEQQRDN